MRGLSPEFFRDLTEGPLRPLLDRVQADDTLLMGLREDYLNVYYRGGSLLKVSRSPGGYTSHFDPKYAKGSPLDLPPSNVHPTGHVDAWMARVPSLKDTMDRWLTRHPKTEREMQQLLARANNRGVTGQDSDVYVCDIEYASRLGRFDIVGVHWASTGPARKNTERARLVLGELKVGDGAVGGKAGLHDHLRDLEAFAADAARRATLEREMVEVFSQLRALGQIEARKDLTAFSDEPPLVLLLLANHKTAKSAVRTALADLPEAPHLDVRIVASSLMGYALYERGFYTLAEAREKRGHLL